MDIIFKAILPVFSVFAIGFFLQKRRRLDIKTISSVTVYVLIPFLVFRSLLEMDIEKEYLMMVAIVFILMMVTIVINKVVVFLNHLDRDTESAFILSTVFMNAGNYGTPIILFVFGERAFHIAVSFYVIQLVLFNTVGIYYASRSEKSFIDGIKRLIKIPVIYAVILAIISRQLPIFPEHIFTIVSLLADGAIPIIMLLLGMQIANLKIDEINWKQISFVCLIRLLVSPLIVVIITLLVPINPIYRNVIIVLASMPTAVNVSLYALEFNIKPNFVSVATILNTFISVITVTVLLNILS